MSFYKYIGAAFIALISLNTQSFTVDYNDHKVKLQECVEEEVIILLKSPNYTGGVYLAKERSMEICKTINKVPDHKYYDFEQEFIEKISKISKVNYNWDQLIEGIQKFINDNRVESFFGNVTDKSLEKQQWNVESIIPSDTCPELVSIPEENFAPGSCGIVGCYEPEGLDCRADKRVIIRNYIDSYNKVLDDKCSYFCF